MAKDRRSEAMRKVAIRNPWIAHVKTAWINDDCRNPYIEYIKNPDIRGEYYEIKAGHSVEYMRWYTWLWMPKQAVTDKLINV